LRTFFLGSRGFCSTFLGAGFDAGVLGALLLGLAAGSFLTGSIGLVPTGFIALSDAILLRYPVELRGCTNTCWPE